jgi:DNA replication and repair protein RecF
MSELDADRRQALSDVLTATPGQALITTTDLDHVPGADLPDTVAVPVTAGAVPALHAAEAGQ